MHVSGIILDQQYVESAKNIRFSTLDSSIVFSVKWLNCYFVETETTQTATTARTNSVAEETVTPKTGIILFTILDTLQLFDHGQ